MNDTKKLSESCNDSTSKNTQRLAPAAPAAVKPAPESVARAKVAPPHPIKPQNLASPQNGWRRAGMWAAGVAGVLLTAGMAGGYATYTHWENSEQIAPNVFIHNQPVGGLTRAQAVQELENRFGRLFVTIQTPARPYTLSVKQLGGEPQIANVVDRAHAYGRDGGVLQNIWQLVEARTDEYRLNLPMRWDKAQLKRVMWNVNYNYRRPSRDAELRVGKEGVQVIAHQTGRDLNVGATLLTLQSKYYPGVKEISATAQETQPRVTSASLAGHDVLLGEYPTRFNPGLWGRTRNIHIAASELDGQVLMPGEEFSFNKLTGQRTWDKGYRMAHIFERKPGQEKSEIVDGLAGGVCQVSSTLYNAVRKANNKVDSRLKIVERNYHSLPVTYVPRGLDATVAWPNRDFRFRNTFTHPIYIRAKVTGSKLVISVWGRVPNDVSAVTVATSPDEATTATTSLSN